MPGIQGTPHPGVRRHARFCREANFGVIPGAPDWVPAPVMEDGFKLKATSEPFAPDTNFGGDHQLHLAIQHKQEVAGDFATLAWPQVICPLLHMALDRQADLDLWSYSFDYYTPSDPRRYLGVVAERLVLAISGTGDNDFRATAGLRAQQEQENDALSEGDFDYSGIHRVPFMHGHAELQLRTVPVTDVEAYTITIENEVAIGPFRRMAGVTHAVVAYLWGLQRRITLDLTKVNNNDAMNDAIRSGGTLSFEASFFHPLAHVLQFQFPMLVVPESDEDGTPSQLAKETPRLMAIVPPDGSLEMIWTCDLATGGTSTLLPLTTTLGPTTTAVPTTEEPTTTTAPA